MQLDRATRDLRNFAMSQPYHLAAYEGSMTLTGPRWHNDEKLVVLETAGLVTPAYLRAFLAPGPSSLLSQVFVRAMISGNATAEEAAAVANALVAPLAAGAASGGARSCFPSQRCRNSRVVELTPPTPAVVVVSSPSSTPTLLRLGWVYLSQQAARNPADPNAAMDMLVQVGPHALGGGPAGAHNALVDLAVHCLSEPFFDTLRTKQGLGYIVAAALKSEAGIDSVR